MEVISVKLSKSTVSTFKLTAITATILSSLIASSTALAKEEEIGDDGYTKTYNDSSKSFKDRMKEAKAAPDMSASNAKTNFTLGLLGDFGPVYDAEPTSTSGMGYGFAINPGFMIQSESWSRIEVGAEIAYHSFSWKPGKNMTGTLSPVSFMPHFGIGHSLGDQLFGIFKFGFGIASGKVDAKYDGTSLSSESRTGFVASVAYDASAMMGSTNLFGGIGATHYKFAYSEFGTGSNKDDLTLNLNHVNLHAGMRMKF
jgi:hypothetical protein